MSRWTLHHGDCLAWLRTLPSESVDAIVTDPPAGIAFMGKAWDHHKGGRTEWVAWLAEVMRECLRVLKPGGHALVWSIPRTEHWTTCAVEDAGFEIRDGVYHLCAQGWPKSLDVSKAIDAAALADKRNVTAPATDDAKRWQGWGSALKPAVERWVLARKSIAGTIASNVLAHSTGALNIDGCRVECDARPSRPHDGVARDNVSFVSGYTVNARAAGETSLGRWPSNVVLSHAETCGDECNEACPVRELDRQSGTLKSGDSRAVNRSGGADHAYGRKYEQTRSYRAPDAGGASRFFPVFHPFGYFGKAKSAGQRGGKDNRHPTVKNVDLMRWLVRLITPRGGLVLDAFGGSGTTGVAALLEGMRFAAAEADDDSYETACKRLATAELGETVVRTVEPAPVADARPSNDNAQCELFAGGTK